MEEIWKDVKDYEGLYQVSNLGKVRTLGKIVHYRDGRTYRYPCKILNQNMARGYLYVNLRKMDHSKKYVAVHRLVAEAFIQNPDNLPEVNHKDENTANNNVVNLEWCSRSYNCKYGTLPQRISNRMKGNKFCVGRIYSEESLQKMRTSQQLRRKMEKENAVIYNGKVQRITQTSEG